MNFTFKVGNFVDPDLSIEVRIRDPIDKSGVYEMLYSVYDFWLTGRFVRQNVIE